MGRLPDHVLHAVPAGPTAAAAAVALAAAALTITTTCGAPQRGRRLLERLQLAAGHLLDRLLRRSRGVLPRWLCQLARRLRLRLRRLLQLPLLHSDAHIPATTATVAATTALPFATS